MDIKFQFEKLDENENVIELSKKYQSKSFVNNFLGILCSDMMADTTNTNVDGTQRTTYYKYGVSQHGGVELPTRGWGGGKYNSNQDLPVDDKGIVVGTGTEPVLVTDYRLGAQIANSNNSGGLEYLGCSCRNFIVNTGAGTASFEVVRMFRNNSGATVTITEMGIQQQISYRYVDFSTYSLNDRFLIVRDIVDPSQNVDDGEILKVTYTIQIEV